MCSCPLDLVLIATEGGADMEPVCEGFMGARTHRSSLATLLQRDLGDSQDSILGAAQVLIDGGALVNAHDEGQFSSFFRTL